MFLIKTRHPGYCLPSAATVARDVKHIFVEMCQQISKTLKVFLAYLFPYPSHHPHPQKVECALNIATDSWTFLNSHAFVAVTVHYEEGGIPRTLLLDIVECAKSHTGVTLAATLVKIFNNFGISDKVWTWKYKKMKNSSWYCIGPGRHMRQRLEQWQDGRRTCNPAWRLPWFCEQSALFCTYPQSSGQEYNASIWCTR